MRLVLRSPLAEQCDAWRSAFATCNADSKEHEVVVEQADIMADLATLSALAKPEDVAIVSPANSFGFMDGGIDLVYTRFFGKKVSERIQERLDGFENPVGCAISVKTDHSVIGVCISAPTMRVPMEIGDTVNAYLAFSAALRDAKRLGIKVLLCPGLGTGTGGMPAKICAKQMKVAWERQILSPSTTNPPFKTLTQAFNDQHFLTS